MDLFRRKAKKKGLTITPGWIAVVGLAGASLWVIADSRRRSLARDKVIGFARGTTKRLRRQGSYATSTVRGKVEGLRHGVDTVPPSDPALAAKVSSEVLGDYPGVNINVERGVVVLRGQLETEARIAELEQSVRKVTGVVDVTNLLHIPGQSPPNVEGARRASESERT
jgi:osmotically-inducible protein OsmY